MNLDIKKRAFLSELLDVNRIQHLMNEIKKWQVTLDSLDFEFAIRHRLERMMADLYENPIDYDLLLRILKLLELFRLLPVEINYWQAQNIYYKIAKTAFRDFLLKAKNGNEDARKWLPTFKYLGEMLFFNIPVIIA